MGPFIINLMYDEESPAIRHVCGDVIFSILLASTGLYKVNFSLLNNLMF